MPLNKMWIRQMQFNTKFIDHATASPEEITAYTKDMLLHMTSEMVELLDASGQWKQFRRNEQRTIRSGIVEESIDIFKFLMNIMIIHGMTPEEFTQEFHWKSDVVEARYKWEHTLASLSQLDKVAAIDLDGVLAEYPEGWIEYVNSRLRSSFTMADVGAFEMMLPTIARAEYEALKHDFRDEGYESLYVKPFADAASFTQALKKLGYTIVILSARPCHAYKRMQVDTLKWIAKHGITADAFMWSSEKHVQIMSRIPWLSFMVEDNLLIAKQVASCGYKVYLRNRPYNAESAAQSKQTSSELPLLCRIDGLDDIIQDLKETTDDDKLTKWRNMSK